MAANGRKSAGPTRITSSNQGKMTIMNKLILTTAALALTASMGMAQTVRMGTEGAYPP